MICFEELDTSGKAWQSLSPEAVDFVRQLLVKDPSKRPSAVEALQHPWLNDANAMKKAADRPLHKSVVQRLQRYGQSSLFKRTILAHIAHDLVGMHFSGNPTDHAIAVVQERSIRGGNAFYDGSVQSSKNIDLSTRSSNRSVRGLFLRSKTAMLDNSTSRRERSFSLGKAFSDSVTVTQTESGSVVIGSSVHGEKKMSLLVDGGYVY